MKIKVLKVIILTLICTLLISFSVLPCFAVGGESDPYNIIIDDGVLTTAIDWDVTFNFDLFNFNDDFVSSSLNFNFDPIFPSSVSDFSVSSSAFESTSSRIDLPNAGVTEDVSFYLDTLYAYDVDNLGLIDVTFSYSTSTLYGSVLQVVGCQFEARCFYYTYSPDDVPETGSPFGFDFDGASSVTTIVNYYELGNAVDAYTVTFESDYTDSGFSPDLFGYSEDESFTLFIDSVIVIPEYDDMVQRSSIDVQYYYDGDYCQFSRAADLNSHITPPSDDVFADYTSWIGLAVSGFLDFQIFPGFSIGGLLMVIISFTTVIWFLKLFAGG